MAAIPASSLARPDGPSPDARSRSLPERTPETSLQVTSDAFAANQAIPSEYTCDGARTTPPLIWSKAPPTTRSVAILMEDPDAPGGGVLHWLVTGIDSTSMFMPPSFMPPGAVVSKNDKGAKEYLAPCATDGGHRYVFHVYALDTTLPPEVAKDVFLGSIQGHILAHGTLLGTYGRYDPSLTVGDVRSDARKTGKAPTPKS